MSTTHEETVTASELASWLNLSRNRIAELAAHSHVVRAAHGKYRLKESVQAYTRYQRGRAAGLKQSDAAREEGDAKSRLDEAKARLAEAEVARAEVELIGVDDAVALFADIVATARIKLLALPCRFPAETRAIAQATVHEVLTELASHDQSELTAKLLAESERGPRS